MLHQPLNPLQISLRCRQIGLRNLTGGIAIGSEDFLALLQSLLKRPNKILTREQLIGERDLDPFDRSIDVRISRLRRKLEDDPQDPKIIKTVYGAGYLLCGTVEWVTGWVGNG